MPITLTDDHHVLASTVSDLLRTFGAREDARRLLEERSPALPRI